jgi:hypothetical protein
MAKTLRTSGDYTIKTGTGAGGSNSVIFDSKTTRVSGDLIVDGTSTTLNTATLTIEDPIIRLAKNNTNTVDTDSGILIERGVDNNAAFYWNEGETSFKAVLTTSDGTGTSITDTSLANIQVLDPTASSHAATKNYVDTEVSAIGGAFSIKFTGDDSTTLVIDSGNTVDIAGGSNINTATSEPDTVTINLNNNLTNIHSITNSSTNADLTLSANSSGSVVIDDVITFNANRSGDPSATSVTKIWAQTPGGGGTGIYFNNTSVSSGAAGEMISKSKATALAIALG